MSRYPQRIDTAIDWLFGDGSDGDVVISVNTALTKDTYYNSLTVNAAVTLTTSGYRLFVRHLLINNGTLEARGNAAIGAAGGLVGVTDTLIGGRPGGAGAVGAGAAGTGSNYVLAANPTFQGGAGGTTGGNAGGAGGIATIGGLRARDPFTAITGYTRADQNPLFAGSGGGGGGGDGAASVGGGGGGGGGDMLIVAREIINNGTFTVAGGAGADGVGVGNASGGGGGGGGLMRFVRRGYSGAGARSVAGGTGGAKTGTIGNVGANGNAGLLIDLIV